MQASAYVKLINTDTVGVIRLWDRGIIIIIIITRSNSNSYAIDFMMNSKGKLLIL